MKKDQSTDNLLRLDFSVSVARDWEGDGSNFIRHIAGKIIFIDDTEEEHTVGEMHLLWIQVWNMLNHEINAWEGGNGCVWNSATRN